MMQWGRGISWQGGYGWGERKKEVSACESQGGKILNSLNEDEVEKPQGNTFREGRYEILVTYLHARSHVSEMIRKGSRRSG